MNTVLEDVDISSMFDFKYKENIDECFSKLSIYRLKCSDNRVIKVNEYVSQLSHENFLQCACYIIALRLKKGILWNTKDNSMFEIMIPNVEDFLNSTVRVITKNQIKEYIQPVIESLANNTSSNNSFGGLTSITIDDKKVAINDKVFHINSGEGIIKKIYFSGNCLLIAVQHVSNLHETNTYD